MTIQEVSEAYLNKLYELFTYDIGVMSQGWMYYWLLIPITFYLVLFIVKWIVLTAPIWLPIHLALGGLSKVIQTIKKED